MRLEHLWLRRFKNLTDFEVEIDPAHAVDVIVGRNGSGKSNLLEALIVIFRDLDLKLNSPSFAYRLRYRVRGHSVEVNADPDRTRGRMRLSVDGNAISLKDFKARASALLPTFVFGYYSGESQRFDSHFDPHRRKYYNRLLSEKADGSFRRLFLAEPFHSQFVLLAFLVDPDPPVLRILNEHLGIEGLSSIQLVLRQPDWSNDRSDRFWGARGLPRILMDAVYEEALAPLRKEEREPRGAHRTVTKEHLYLRLEGVESLRRIYELFGSRNELFKALESVHISDLLFELKVVVQIRGKNAEVEFRELSEGEQQLLIVLGLLKFTQSDDSLLLLDEPDTHLNPAWSVRYTELLMEVMGEMAESQVLMATHDPLVVASLVREQVLLLDAGEGGRISVGHPERDPRGMGVAALLTSDIYGLRSQLDLVTQRLLDEKRSLASRDDRTAQEDQRLQELVGIVEEVDLAASARDPLFREFVEAMSARRTTEPQPIALTRDEIEARERIAGEVFAELEGERGRL